LEERRKGMKSDFKDGNRDRIMDVKEKNEKEK